MSETVRLHASGLSFTTIVAGPDNGEPVMFLHGFPDAPSTFRNQVARLADDGYRCLVPTMRGYEPSNQPTDGDYSLETLATDVVALLDAAGIDRAHIVGHDWGAAVAHVLGGHHGHRCRTLTAMAVPPTQRIPAAVRKLPRQILLSWYMTFFQLRFVADKALQARNWALLRWLWRRWSPGLDAPADVIDTFSQPGVVGASLAYYRQNATPPLLLGLRSTPAMEPHRSGAPMMIMHGDQDGCMDYRLFGHAIVADDYPHGIRHELITGVGHFLHLEKPDLILDLLLDWLGQGDRPAP